eukprot:TRINITY_DN3055_c0_g1_i2.p1 TRINITY_DN3055_c0_g1~~TRINITY_DN3055_c0_g1_i2.p1  ORF type:complete len:353 (-),score=89.90 TRINITY_DN3055_c0_g1_i2:38-1096(-)
MFDVPSHVKAVMHTIRQNRNIAAHNLALTSQDIDYSSASIRDYQNYYYDKKHKKPKHNDKILIDITSVNVVRKGRKEAKVCSFGYQCTREDCRFIHKEGRAIDEDEEETPNNSTACKFGKGCTRQDCTFSHPEGRDIDPPPSNATVCKFGRGCTRQDCSFKHPDGRDIDPPPSNSAVCKFGKGCTRQDCTFSHPEGRDIDPPSYKFGKGGKQEPSKEGKLKEHTSNSQICKYGKGCKKQGCSKTHPEGRDIDPPSYKFGKQEVKEAPNSQVCKFGKGCKKQDCTFSHPEGRDIDPPPSNSGVCKFGIGCTKQNCKFKHPNQMDIDPPKTCKFGKGCTKQDCPYYHPEGRNNF